MSPANDASKTRTILAWIGISLLGALFIMAGAGKFTGAMDEQLDTLGVPAWAIPAIGIIEVTAGIALIIPRSRFYGAAILAGTMIGAVLAHLINADWAGTPPSVVLAALATLVAWRTRPDWFRQRLPLGASA